MIHYLFYSLAKFPIGSILLCICILNILWFIYIWQKKKPPKKLFIAYTFYVLSIVIWVATNFYFHSELLTIYDERLAVIIGLISNIGACFSAVVVFYISCLLKNKNEKILKIEWIFIWFVSLINIFTNIYPGITIQYVQIIDPHTFILVQGQLAWIYFAAASLLIIPSIINFFIAIKFNNSLKKEQGIYILFGTLIIYSIGIFSNVIAPLFSQKYTFVWLPPLLSLIPIFLFGYAVFAQRFPSLKFIFINLAKLATILIFAGAIFYLLTLKVLAGLPFFYSQTIALGIFGILVFKSASLFGTDSLQDLLIFNSVERFKREAFRLRNKKIVYITLEELNNDIQKTFCKKLFISSCHIIPINKIDQKHYPELIKYATKNLQTILVTKEIQLQKNQQQYPTLAQELERIGEICLPLLNPDKKLIGFFVLGHKAFHKLYTKEEIEAIQTTQCHFSTVLTSVLHSTKLQDQLEAKNQMLEKQNTEMKRLIQQQKDFINVSAHELRTPLSISHAYASILPQSEEVKNLQFGLDRLTERVNEIVYVNEHDGKQVGFNPTKVKIPDFFTQIYKNFEPTMQKKERQFNFDNKIETKTEAEFDTCKITQVIENLLSNALKFTKAEGIITLHLGIEGEKLKFAVTDNGCGVPDDTKEEIFKKFRGNHSTKDKGLGLGLYLCKSIVKMHKGKIWCEDAPLNGTTFYVTIPLTQPQEVKESTEDKIYQESMTTFS